MLQTNILFVDATNNGRSILAEAYFNKHCAGSARAFSAGVRPPAELDRHVYEILRENNIPPDDYCPKPIDIFLQPYSPRIDLIIGFKPRVEDYKLPIFANQPTLDYLTIEPVIGRQDQVGRKRAFRDCYHDISLTIDRAMASGQLPSSRAA